MAGESHPIGARLAREVAEHRLEFDPAQRDAAARLDVLSAALRSRPRRFGAWRRVQLRLGGAVPSGAPHRGLYLWGGVGRGKTLLMDLFYETLDFPQRERTHFYRFMRAVHADLRALARHTNPLDAVAHRLAKRTRVICLDEFFVADIADAMILAGLFGGLFRRAVTLVATSNQPPWELYAGGLQRQRFLPAIELIETHTQAVHVDGGTDYRLRHLERARTFLDSNDPRTDAELHRLFRLLAADQVTGPAPLMIEGRPIRAVSTGPGIAWFEYRELCEGPRSQIDYIELARSYHTIFLSNVPVLREGDEDAARRLLMLIDELYDRAVKLIVSAAARPEALYRGERLAVEFQRAASRLIEMQSQRYLSRQHGA